MNRPEIGITGGTFGRDAAGQFHFTITGLCTSAGRARVAAIAEALHGAYESQRLAISATDQTAVTSRADPE